MSEKIRIAFFLMGEHGWVGGREYSENLIYALGKLFSGSNKFELCVITDQEVSPHIKKYLSKIYTEEDMFPTNLTERVKWRLRRRFSKMENPNFYSFIQQEEIDFLYPYNDREEVPNTCYTVAWIPDFQHKYLPENFSKFNLKQLDRKFTKTTRNALKVILSSKMAEEDCHRYYPESIGKTSVLPFRTLPLPGWYEGNPVDTQKKYNLPDKFLLVSNQFWKHKNHLLVFKAIQLLKKKSIFPTIVCTGHLYDPRCPEYSDTVLSRIHELDISEQVKILGFITKYDQIQLLRRAITVIQPSLFEGWSTIVENSRCFGKPIILSDFPVHKEQDPPNSLFYERNSVKELADCISTCWDTLAVGPDLDEEKKAHSCQTELILEYGKCFMNITKLM